MSSEISPRPAWQINQVFFGGAVRMGVAGYTVTAPKQLRGNTSTPHFS
jgi:hypothetical protein